MKKIFTLILIVSLSLIKLNAQSFDWVRSNPVNYTMNPAMAKHNSCISSNGNIYAGRMVNFTYYFGSIFGTSSIDCYNNAGQLQWSFPFGQKTVIEQMSADANGNLLIGGIFLETLMFTATDSLNNISPPLTPNVFLFSLDAAGSLRWKRNLTLTNSNSSTVLAMNADHQDNFWYVDDNIFDMNIHKLDNNGQDVQNIALHNARSVGGICFDANDNLFVTGSTEMGTMTIGSLSTTVPDTYMMFVAFIQSSGAASWVRLATDATFQNPVCVSDGAGGAYVAGNLMVPTSFGTVSFQGPEWVYDVFLTHVDASGNFSWGIEIPHQPTLTGDFLRGSNNFIASDAAGNVYMMGICRGVVDWGNGIVSGGVSVPLPSQQISIVVFDPNGNPVHHLEGGNSDFDQVYSLHIMPAGDAYFSGAVIDTAFFGSNTVNPGGDLAYVIGRINTVVTSVAQSSLPRNLSVYPVPANNFLYINDEHNFSGAQVYNMQGALIINQSRGISNHSLKSIDIAHLSPGNYVLKLNDGKDFRKIIFSVSK